MDKRKKDEIQEDRQAKAGCCGGPAPKGVSACCAKDAEAKAGGEEGCGCNVSMTHADIAHSSCCGKGGPEVMRLRK